MESVKFMACELWSAECGVETVKFVEGEWWSVETVKCEVCEV